MRCSCHGRPRPSNGQPMSVSVRFDQFFAFLPFLLFSLWSSRADERVKLPSDLTVDSPSSGETNRNGGGNVVGRCHSERFAHRSSPVPHQQQDKKHEQRTTFITSTTNTGKERKRRKKKGKIRDTTPDSTASTVTAHRASHWPQSR
jgi:hypothetical protein